MAEIDPEDWARPGTSAIVERVMAGIKPGAIILMHDGSGDRSQTLAALPTILSDLAARGYRVLPLDTLLGYKQSSPTSSGQGSEPTMQPTTIFEPSAEPTQLPPDTQQPVFLIDTESPVHPAARFPLGVPRLYCWTRNGALPPGAEAISYTRTRESSSATLYHFSVPRADGHFTYGYIDTTPCGLG